MVEPYLLDAIISGLELGTIPLSVVLETAGLRTRTFTAWMLTGRRNAAEGQHGDDDPCDECTERETCARWCCYVSLYTRVLRARANGCADLLADVVTKAKGEKGGSRVLLELARSLYPDKVHNWKARKAARYTEHETLGGDPDELRDDHEALELAQASANVARTEAQTELAKAQKETLGKSGSYFDKLIVAVAGAVAGQGVRSDGNEPTQAELEAASPSVGLDGELE